MTNTVIGMGEARICSGTVGFAADSGRALTALNLNAIRRLQDSDDVPISSLTLSLGIAEALLHLAGDPVRGSAIVQIRISGSTTGTFLRLAFDLFDAALELILIHLRSLV
jgi:hypothetical protein